MKPLIPFLKPFCFWVLFCGLSACSPSMQIKEGRLEGPTTLKVGGYHFLSYSPSVETSSGACDGLLAATCDDYDPGVRSISVNTTLELAESPDNSHPEFVDRGEEGKGVRYFLFKPDRAGTYRIKVTSTGTIMNEDGEAATDSHESLLTLEAVPMGTTGNHLVIEKEYASLTELEDEIGPTHFQSGSQEGVPLTAGVLESLQFFWGCDYDNLCEALKIGEAVFEAPFYGLLTSGYTFDSAFYTDKDGDGIDEIYFRFDWRAPYDQPPRSFYFKLRPISAE